MKHLKKFETVFYDEEEPKVGDYVFMANSDYTPDYSEIYIIRDIVFYEEDYIDNVYVLHNLNGEDDYITISLNQIVCFSENLEDLEEIRTANKYNL